MLAESKIRLSRLADQIPEGSIAKTYVYGLLTLGAAASIATRSRHPFVCSVQGLAGATEANTLSSLINHRSGVHGSVELSPNTIEMGRVAQAATVGLKVDRGAAAHRVHHDNTDKPDDPHSPVNEGRWRVFTRLPELIKRFADEHPELVAQEQSNPYTRKRSFDRAPVTAAGIIGMHMALGKKTGLPIGYRLASSAIHIGGEFILNATFTADSHLHGAPQNLNLDPLTSIVMGGEVNHKDHHDNPKDPRHGKFDPAYALARGLEYVGLATIPSQPSRRRLFTRKAA